MALKFKPDMAKFTNELMVNEVNLDESALNQSSLVCYYMDQKAQAERQYSALRLKQDIVYSRKYSELQAEFISAEKRVTEKALDSMIKVDAEYQRVALEVILAKEIRDQLEACIQSLVDRKKLIQQLLDFRMLQAGGSVPLRNPTSV